MAKKRISINDIAAQFNVSAATISYIMNGKAKEKRISDELTDKVLKWIDEVGYRPSQLAKSLRTGTSRIIGLMVDDISNPFFADLAKLIEDLADRHGYRIIFCSTDNDTAKAGEIVKMFRDRNVDGYIIAPPEGIEKELISLQKDGIPLVLFDRFLPALETNYVVTDNFNSTYQAVQHFVAQGFKNPALITSDSTQYQMRERERGYHEAIETFNLSPVIEKVSVVNNHAEIIEKITALLKKNKQVDAILFSSNYLTICGLEVFEQLKVAIPADVAIIAFDDHDLFKFYSPSVTVIAQPLKKFSEEILQILLAQLKGQGQVSQQIIPADLIARASTQKIK